MNRLTKDNYCDDCFRIQNERNQLPEYKSNHYSQAQYDVDLWHKVKEREDIEEKLGIDLVTLFKALENGIWIKIDDWAFGYGIEKTPVFIKKVDIGYQDYDEVDKNYKLIIDDKNVLCIYELPYDGLDRCARIKDYGRTWALTREELENDR